MLQGLLLIELLAVYRCVWVAGGTDWTKTLLFSCALVVLCVGLWGYGVGLSVCSLGRVS